MCLQVIIPSVCFQKNAGDDASWSWPNSVDRSTLAPGAVSKRSCSYYVFAFSRRRIDCDELLPSRNPNRNAIFTGRGLGIYAAPGYRLLTIVAYR